MKRLLQLGFILGLGATIAAAYFVPWIDYPRFHSGASVVANGGRVEQFMVRLPADRIDSGADATAEAADPSAPELAHYKLRDAEGNVIGVAARHEVSIGGASETSWLLTLPSRGSLALAAETPNAQTIDELLAERGLVAGRNLDPGLSIDFGSPARSHAATGEFAGIEFELVETWVVTGIDQDGGIRGTLRLNTIGRQAI